ncbi:MAG: GyrI-like domain-containing protein [Mariprofundales bacterium]
MPNQDDDIQPLVPKKILIGALFALILALFGGVGMVFYLGMFESIVVKKQTTEPFYGACLSYKGDYKDIGTVIERVQFIAKENKLEYGDSFAMYYDDVNSVTVSELRSKACVMLKDSTAYLPEPLELEAIKSRLAVTTAFHGSPMLGSYKSYPAMYAWAIDRGYDVRMPSIEIYREDGSYTDYQWGIVK